MLKYKIQIILFMLSLLGREVSMCCVCCIAISVMWWCYVCRPDCTLSFFVLDAACLTYVRAVTFMYIEASRQNTDGNTTYITHEHFLPT